MKLSKEIVEKLKNAGSAEDVQKILMDAGEDVPAENAKQIFMALHQAMNKSSNHKISDADLDGVSGGWSWTIPCMDVEWCFGETEYCECFDKALD